MDITAPVPQRIDIAGDAVGLNEIQHVHRIAVLGGQVMKGRCRLYRVGQPAQQRIHQHQQCQRAAGALETQFVQPQGQQGAQHQCQRHAEQGNEAATGQRHRQGQCSERNTLPGHIHHAPHRRHKIRQPQPRQPHQVEEQGRGDAPGFERRQPLANAPEGRGLIESVGQRVQEHLQAGGIEGAGQQAYRADEQGAANPRDSGLAPGKEQDTQGHQAEEKPAVQVYPDNKHQRHQPGGRVAPQPQQ